MRTNAFQSSAHKKLHDPQVAALCQHLRSAVDLLEQIVSRRGASEEVSIAPSPSPAPTSAAPGINEPAQAKLAYTVKEATTALGISRTTLYRLRQEGQLPVVKLGSRSLIPADALRAMLASLPSR